MGSGRFSHEAYATASTLRSASGISDFHYSDTAIARGDYKVHADLDPKGLTVRECRDSADHPLALPIAVFFDVTGSMSTYPRLIQAELPNLLAHLENRVPDPQIMVGGIGDAFSDRVPLQVGQFESDNRIDDQLRSILLEGGGGGGNHESYELAFYLLARHTAADQWEKGRGKGYAFIIGDERAYETVDSGQVAKIIGGGFQGDIITQSIVAEAQTKFHTFFIAVNNGYLRQNEQYWRGLVGNDYYLTLDDPANLVTLLGDTVVKQEMTNAVATTP
jgi:hypothetical protein